MWDNSEEQFLFNHGWEHLWFHPKNLFIRELVKGPFLKPKLLYPIPYVTLCQQDGTSVKPEEGIPDCWAEYLAHNFIFLRKHLRNYELMHKEDVEIVPQLRKNYRLYIGQGIPDPWISYPYIDNPEIIAHINPKDVKKFQWPHRKKENCYCCEKKYLFDCPDKSNLNPCRCRDCHGRHTTLTADCGENCKCISVLRDWVLKNTDLKRRKNRHRNANPESDLSSSNDSKTEDEGPNVKAEPLVFCECLRHYKASNDSSESDLGGKSNEKPHNTYNRSKRFSKKTQSRICRCPYVKNIYVKRYSGPDGRNFSESTKTISKKIQTENPPDKDSKTVQTEDSKSKLQLKCHQCSKCSHCGLPQCKAPLTKVTHPTMQSVPNLCFTPSVIHNPAIICPYSFPAHFMLRKPSKHDEIRKVNKKQEKSRPDEDESNAELGGKRRQSKADEESVLWKSEAKDPQIDSKNDDFKNNRNSYYCQPSAKSFDHFKYLTDEKLKEYLQREERVLGKSGHSGSKFVNFSRDDLSGSTVNAEKFKLGRFKTFSYSKPKLCESFEDGKMVYLGNSRRHAFSRLKTSSDQATMTVPEEAKKSKNEVLSKVKYFKETGESDESRVHGEIRNCNKANRRRRRLLSNRKRRRKLAASGKSSILEYQTLLSKLTKSPELVNKQVQVEETHRDYHFSKKVSFSENNPSPLGSLNLGENTCLSYKDSCSPNFERETAKGNCDGYSKSRTLRESLQKSLRSDMRFGGTLEKISNTNRGTWTSNALKNIMDDILIEKKSKEI